MRKLHINADDFGLTPGVSAGIYEAVTQGAVSTTTAMLCVDGGKDAVSRYAAFLEGRIGLHLQLTSGVPVNKFSCDYDWGGEKGAFPARRKQLSHLSAEAVHREWRSQLVLLQSFGVTPCHLDSHHHVHRLPGAREAALLLAREACLPVRGVDPETASFFEDGGVKTLGFCQTEWFRHELSTDGFVKRVCEAFETIGGSGTVEIMVHPGYMDSILEKRSSYAAEREKELCVLMDIELPDRLEEIGIAIV